MILDDEGRMQIARISNILMKRDRHWKKGHDRPGTQPDQTGNKRKGKFVKCEE